MAVQTTHDTNLLGSPSKPRNRQLSGLLRFIRQKPLAAAGGAVIVLLILVAALAPLIAPYAYDEPKILERFQGPSASHLFGTDAQGRDAFSRVIYGAQITVVLAFSSVLLSTLIATVIGVVSGYFGGVVDTIIQRFVEIWQAFPGFIFIIFVISVIGPSRLSLILVFGLLFGVGSSRVVRSSVLSVRQLTYVEAASAIGATHTRLILRHILPNIVPVIIVTASVQVGGVILAESSLSFLGFGTPPPFPSWGRMLQEAQTNMTRFPHLALFPGLAIAMVVYSVNMLGDGLRDVLDPRMRGSR